MGGRQSVKHCDLTKGVHKTIAFNLVELNISARFGSSYNLSLCPLRL